MIRRADVERRTSELRESYIILAVATVNTLGLLAMIFGVPW